MRTLLLALVMVAGTAGRATAAGSAFPPAGLGSDTLPGLYRDPNSWFSQDKFYHFAISAAGSGGVYSFGREIGLGRWQSAAAGVFIMGTAGILREIGTTDRSNLLIRTRISRKDLVWDGVGIVVGVSLTDLYYRNMRPGRRSPPPPSPEAAARDVQASTATPVHGVVDSWATGE